MDPVGIIIIFVVTVVAISLCSYCCKRHRGKVLGPPQQTGITVTTSTSVPQPQPPYPVVPQHPVPQSATPGIGFQVPGYPYSAPGGVMAQPVYPPQIPPTGAVMPPPSYHEAVGQPVTHETYAKQAPYNPNY